MTDVVAAEDRSFARVAAIGAIASVPLALGNLLAMLITVHFDLRGMTDPLVLLRAGRSSGTMWRLSMLLDLGGYYLSIVPLVFVLRSMLRSRTTLWIDLCAWCMLAYCLIGAIGGAELATAIPRLIRDYAADPARRAIVQSVFTGYTDGVYHGLWNLLEELLAGIGWIGFGVALRRLRPRLGVVTIALGIACLVDSFGVAIAIDAIAATGLTVYLVLAPLWAGWTGIELLRALPTGRRSLLASSA